MSSHVSDITSGIKTLVASSLGSTYSELPYAYDVNKNSKIVAKGYAVIPLAVTQTEGTTRQIYVDQQFQIIVNDKFLASQSSDAAKKALVIAIYDKLLDIYGSLVANKPHASVLIISDMAISEPEILEENDFISLRMDFNIKHRYSF